MIVSFVETMRGRVTEKGGNSHPLEFTIKAEAPTLRGYLHDGRSQVSGIVRAPPWAAETSAGGTLVLSPLHRSISYRLEFRSSAGTPLTLEGAKRVSLGAPLHSMTHLPVTLSEQAGAALATGELVFPISDLLPFAASWLPFRRGAQLRLDVQRRAIERQALAGI